MVQVSNKPIVVRIKFKKVGALRYISHLDLVRTMMKIVVRSRLPLWYTEGFNPKPKLVFAAPLSIGTDSTVEFMDLRLSERVDPGMVRTKLNACMTSEMQISEAYYPTSPLTELAWLSYEIRILPICPTEELCLSVRTALDAPVIEVLKKTKSGERTVDIKPQIYSSAVTLEGEAIVVRVVLSAESSTFLNPEYIVTYLKDSVGILREENLMKESYSILRDGAYRKDLTPFQ